MPSSELEPASHPEMPVRNGYLGRFAIVAFVASLSGAVGYAIAFALGCSSGCAPGRSPLTFALLLGLTGAFAAASGLPKRA